jgi:D-sedoheptulose 7-phosphate isomerase
MLFAISSSGSSKNILNAVSQAKVKDCRVVTLSGFSLENPLRAFGNYNCFIDSFEHGIVELAHQVILHNSLDYFMDRYLK